MAGIKIHQYPLERTSIGDEDYYDIDYWTGSSYQTAKIKGSTLKNVLGANYIDITAFISGYELTDKDAGKLITNSNSNVRTLVIPSGLALPNNMITVKGRIAIQPETGVNITLPDGSTITEPSQFTCVADEVYILHKSAFSGDNYILVSIKKSENIGTNDLIITDTIRELQVAENGTFQIVTNDPNNSAIFRVGENSNERFSEIELNSITYDVTTAEPNPTNNGAGIITRINPNEYEIESRSDIGNSATKRGRIYMSPNETIIEQIDAGRLTFNKSGGNNTFEDLQTVKKGIEYNADYSANFSVRSLVDKGYVDSGLSLKLNIADAYGGKRYTLIKPNGTKEFYDTLTQVRSNWADGDVLHQFADETINWALSASDSMFVVPSINWNGNGFKITMQNFTNSNTVGFLITSKTVSIFDLNFDVNINENNTFFIRVGGTGVLNLSNVKGVQINTTGVGANTFMLDFSSTAILNGDRNTVFSSLGTIVVSGANATVVGYQGTSGNIVNGVTFNNFRALTSLNGSNNVVNGARLSGNSTLTNFTFNQTFSTEAFASGTFNIQDAKIIVNCSTLTNGTVVTNFTDVSFENLSTGQFQTNGCLLIDSYFTMNGVNYEGSGGITARGCTFISTNGVQNIRENTGFVDVQDCTFIANNTTTSGCNLLPIGTGFRVVDCILIKNGANGGNIRLGSAVPATINLLGNTYNKGVDYLFSLIGGIAATAKASNVNRLTQSIDYLGQKGIGLSSQFPKMTTTERNALTNIEKGYTIENTTTNFLQVYNGSTWKDLLDLT